jgi:1-acyl-sn-glycerol-3-phosphate acyltransferase
MKNLKAWLANLLLNLFGWQLVGEVPREAKHVLIAAPHTSNWDFVYMYLAAKGLKVDLSWMGKESLFRGPMGPIFRAMGGVAVSRGGRHNMVVQMVEAIDDRATIMLAIPPSGTRDKTPNWKSGFYHIAVAAKVPLLFGFVDYDRKRTGIGPSLMPTGDVAADMDVIRAFYADITARYPELTSRIGLKSEVLEETGIKEDRF